MRRRLFAALVAVNFNAIADCKNALPLEGVVAIRTCNPKTDTCITGKEAAFDYALKVKGADEPDVLNVGIYTSPWRFYDQDMRIMRVEELADMMRERTKKGLKKIQIIGSWTGAAPDAATKSLAQKLSDALDGFPVTGFDGFLWIAPNGATRTTRQAVTVKQGRGTYYVAPGEEVMVSLAAGWPAELEDMFANERDADGVMRAGAGWDIYFLCPDRALQAFEAAAKLSHSIAAYNAAMMRLDRNQKGDAEIAATLLAQAAAAGDKRAQALLERVRKDRH